MQTPLQTVPVQALRNTRLFEGLRVDGPFQLPKTPIPLDPAPAASCPTGIGANTTGLANKPQYAFLALTALLTATLAPQAHADQPKQIVFVCLHGSVKSQMAAAYFLSLIHI